PYRPEAMIPSRRSGTSIRRAWNGERPASPSYNEVASGSRRPDGEDEPMAADDLTDPYPSDPTAFGQSAFGPGRTPGAFRDVDADDEAVARRVEDHALIRRAQAGDERAFAELVEKHRLRAWRVARGLVGSDEDAQDLVQEAFLRVFRSLSSFDF